MDGHRIEESLLNRSPFCVEIYADAYDGESICMFHLRTDVAIFVTLL